MRSIQLTVGPEYLSVLKRSSPGPYFFHPRHIHPVVTDADSARYKAIYTLRSLGARRVVEEDERNILVFGCGTSGPDRWLRRWMLRYKTHSESNTPFRMQKIQ